MPGENTNPQGSAPTDVHGSLKAYLESNSSFASTKEPPKDTAAASPEDSSSVEVPEVEVVENEDQVTDEVTSESQVTAEGEEGEELSLDLLEDDEPIEDSTLSEDFLSDDDLEKRIKVSADGEEFEITVKEAKEGYQRQQDYTRKTQEVSALKRAYVAEAEQLKQGLEMIQSFMAAELVPYEQMDWQALKESDQTQYLVKQQEYQDAQSKVRGVYQSYQQLLQKQAAAKAELAEERAREESKKLIEFRPELADKAKAKEVFSTWVKSAMEVGFGENDLKGVNDSRVFKLLDKAAKYDALVAKQKGIKNKKVVNAPRTVQKGQTRDSQQTETQRNEQAIVERFTREKSVDSAAALISQRLRSR